MKLLIRRRTGCRCCSASWVVGYYRQDKAFMILFSVESLWSAILLWCVRSLRYRLGYVEEGEKWTPSS